MPRNEDLETVRRLLAYIGEDPDREGLQETPARFLKASSRALSPLIGLTNHCLRPSS